MTDSELAISTKNLRKVFNETVAVDDLTLTVRKHTITGLLGGNGAGKSTTLGMLLGLLEPTSGRMTMLGYDMPRARDQIAPFINFSSPYVDLPNRLTVRQNLIVYGKLYNVGDLKRRIDELIGMLQIDAFIDRRHGSLSAGQRTRASLAKSLLNKPRLLLLDEPTASLDPETAEWVRHLLKKYRDENDATILMSSHNMYEVENMCDTVLIMKEGSLTAQGAPQELLINFKKENLEQVFLEIARSHA